MTVNQWIAVAALVGAAWLCRYQSLGAAGRGVAYFQDRWSGDVYVAFPSGYRRIDRLHTDAEIGLPSSRR